MAHEIHLETNINQVVNRDIKLTVKTGPKGKLRKLGALLISKGNIEWIPSGNSVNKHRMKWDELATLIEEHGKPVKAK